MNDYSDIINLPHHESLKRTRMSLENRAAQFAPFSALTGYSEAIKEVSRITIEKYELDDDRKRELDKKIQILSDVIKIKPEIIITYYVSDKKKNGGKYEKIKGNIKKIDLYNKLLIFNDNIKIFFYDIYEIESEIFKDFF